MGPYIFVIAAVLAAVSIAFIFKINIGKIKENQEQLSKVQANFFIGVAISEAIPILLLIFGFINLEPVSSTEELYLPAIIIIFTMAVTSFFIFLQKMVDVTEENKANVNLLTMIAIAMVNAIPLIALVFLFIQM